MQRTRLSGRPKCEMISRRAASETVSTSVARSARPARQQPPAQPFLPAKPFRMRGKRDVVHEHDGRRLRAAAAPCSRARRTRRGDPVSPPSAARVCSHAVPGAPGMTRSSALRSGVAIGLVRVEHERVPRRSRIRRPCAQQPRQMTADAGGFAAELAGVNADAHFDCGRSTGRRREQACAAAARAARLRRRAARRAPSGSR